MSYVPHLNQLVMRRPRYAVFNPSAQADRSVQLWINGYPARILIWSAEEWEQMEVRPPDAQFHPFGVWCALRLD